MFNNSRAYNTIVILDDFTIRKTSKICKKIEGEFEWLKNPGNFRCPKVSNFKKEEYSASYEIEYIHGKTLSQLYVNEELSIDEFVKIFEYLRKLIFDNLNKGVSEEDYFYLWHVKESYFQKTSERLHNYGFKFDKPLSLNQDQLPPLNELLKDIEVNVENEDLCFIHGDLCLSNIILSEDYYKTHDLENSLYFIDPRGCFPNDTISQIGDYKYEVGKLAHSIIGKYDIIKTNHVNATTFDGYNFMFDYNISDYKRTLDEKFFEIFGELEYMYNVMIHLFLSMVPLHYDNKQHQITFFANALRLYKEKQLKFR